MGGKKALLDASPVTGKIPWISRTEPRPTANATEDKFYLQAIQTGKSLDDLTSPVGWQSGCKFTAFETNGYLEYWDSPEQYTDHKLKNDKFLVVVRKFIHGLLPVNARLFLYLLCEH